MRAEEFLTQIDSYSVPWDGTGPLDLIVDLSNVCRCGEDNSARLENLLEALKDWTRRFHPELPISLVCIADRSLVASRRPGGTHRRSSLRPLPTPEIEILKRLVADRRVRIRDFADPEILSLAATHPETSVLSSDRFREFRVSEHQWLEGTTRVFSCASGKDGIRIRRATYWSSPATLSRAAEINEFASLTEGQRQFVDSRVWECDNADCASDPDSVLTPSVTIERDRAICRCPFCDAVMTVSQERRHSVVLEASAVGPPRQALRFLVEEGDTLMLGSAEHGSRLALWSLLGADEAAVPLNHVSIHPRRLAGSPRKWQKWELKLRRASDSDLPVTLEIFDNHRGHHRSVRDVQPGETFVINQHHRVLLGAGVRLRITGRHVPNSGRRWWSLGNRPIDSRVDDGRLK